MAKKTPKEKKFQISATIEPLLNTHLETFTEQNHISSKSTALNVILATFMQEDWQSKIELPLRDSILVPKEIYMSIHELSPYATELMIKNKELKPFKLLDCEYFSIKYTKGDILLAKLEKYFSLQEMFGGLNKKLLTVLDILGAKNDYLSETYESFKQTKEYKPIFETTYLSLLNDIRAELEIKKDFLKNTKGTVLLDYFGNKYEDNSAKMILEPLIHFLHEML